MEVVIGGSRGLGLAIAMELARDRDVIAVARSEPQPAFALPPGFHGNFRAA